MSTISMEYTYRPRLSRETRLLLTTAAVALALLWLLARLRFPDRPVTPSPVPPLLSQLSLRPAYDELAAPIGDLRNRLESSLHPVTFPTHPSAAVPAGLQRIAVLHLGESRAIAWLPPSVDDAHGPPSIVAVDKWTRVAVLNALPSSRPTMPWVPASPMRPRYLIATDPSDERVAFRPVFVGGLEPIASSISNGAVWLLPTATDVLPGTFLFTVDGSLAGMVLRDGRRLVLVPGDRLGALADQVLADADLVPGDLGIEVQELTGSVADAIGAESGVVVTWMESATGTPPALEAGDVIESVDDAPVPTLQEWTARTNRIVAGATVTLRVRRGEAIRDIRVVTRPQIKTDEPGTIGATMRSRRGLGTEILGVDAASAAERAGLRAGDVITMVGDIKGPSPAQVARAYGDTAAGRPTLVAVTRGSAHLLTTLER